jgi:hypothetical protein
MKRATIVVDDRTGTLTARSGRSEAVICDHAPNDWNIVLGLDRKRRVVGVTLLHATEADPRAWFEHPDRPCIPTHIRGAIDGWFAKRPSAGTQVTPARRRV